MEEKAKWDELFNRIAKTVQEWREENPTATLTEIEKAVDKELSGVRVKMVEEMALQSRNRDLARVSQEKRPQCPECGEGVIANGKGKRKLTTSHEQQVELERSQAYCPKCETTFFPLDKELGLISGHYTPRLQESMTRLGSKLPFEQALEEIEESYQVKVAESTLRYITYRHGKGAEEVIRQEVAQIEEEAPEAEAKPEKLVISVDGAFVPLVGGEWREVKSVAVGEVAEEWSAKENEIVVKTKQLSYFSRSYRVREFERVALAELHHRGLANAQTVIAINDGAPWIQGFVDYHAPQAVRIIDFVHTQTYIAQAGKAIWGENTPHFSNWYTASSHCLKHKPLPETLANLRLLQPKAKTDEQSAQLDTALFYIQSRQEMMDYPRFRRLGYPIGSGSVESGHKVVAHARLKGAGMRWAPHHVDPMLSLRNLLANKRWHSGWQQISSFHLQKRSPRRRSKKLKTPSEPVTFSALKAKGLLPDLDDLPPLASPDSQVNKAPKLHPWRSNRWPTYESRYL